MFLLSGFLFNFQFHSFVLKIIVVYPKNLLPPSTLCSALITSMWLMNCMDILWKAKLYFHHCTWVILSLLTCFSLRFWTKIYPVQDRMDTSRRVCHCLGFFHPNSKCPFSCRKKKMFIEEWKMPVRLVIFTHIEASSLFIKILVFLICEESKCRTG